jgi:hypothetical protein
MPEMLGKCVERGTMEAKERRVEKDPGQGGEEGEGC